MVEMLTASQAFWKDKTEAQHRHHDERWFRLYAQELLAIMPSGGTLLDVGCGAAQLTTYLAGQFDSIIGIDLSESMLAAGRARIANQAPRVALVRSAATALPFASNSIDVILAYGVIQYFDTAALQRHVMECARVLRPSGKVCWGQIPNARLRRLWYAGALMNPRPSLI